MYKWIHMISIFFWTGLPHSEWLFSSSSHLKKIGEKEKPKIQTLKRMKHWRSSRLVSRLECHWFWSSWDGAGPAPNYNFFWAPFSPLNTRPSPRLRQTSHDCSWHTDSFRIHWPGRALLPPSQKRRHHQAASEPIAEIPLLCCNRLSESTFIYDFLHSVAVKTFTGCFMLEENWGSLNLCSWAMVTPICLHFNQSLGLFALRVVMLHCQIGVWKTLCSVHSLSSLCW